MPRLLTILIATMALTALGWRPSPATAASFDCAKAAKPDEIAVCADRRLSDLDSLMEKAYAQARKSSDADDRAHALSDARVFLARRGRCGSSVGCLLSAYVGVLEDFSLDGSSVSAPPISALDMAGTIPPESRGLPIREGDCAQTRITAIGGRLEGDKTFESGTSVDFANGGHQVDYDKVPGIIHSRLGDHVLMCLTSIPKHCPPGDDRGRSYVTTNLRTQETWSEADSQHMCGGA